MLTPPDTWSCPTLELTSVLMLRPTSLLNLSCFRTFEFRTSLGTSVFACSIKIVFCKINTYHNKSETRQLRSPQLPCLKFIMVTYLLLLAIDLWYNICTKFHSKSCKDVGGVEKTNFDWTEGRNDGQSKHLMPSCHFMAGA